MKIKTVGVIGMGQFGTFMVSHLEKYVTVIPYTRHDNPEVLSVCDAVIFSVPFSGLAEAITRVTPYIKKDACIIDVTSVKQKPLSLLKKKFKGYQILGTHPVFGPQSGAKGIAGLPMVVCNVSCNKQTYAAIVQFLKKTLQLHVIEQTPKEHDHQMAQIQALTHFIGRALVNLDIQSFPTNTKSYAQLLELKNLLQFDSWELFTTIQNINPEAKKVRKKFLKELHSLEAKLEKQHSKASYPKTKPKG
jgi:prephenate dehydrogenase